MGFSMLKARTASTLKWFIRTPLAWPMTSLLVSAASNSLARARPDPLVGFALIGMVHAVGGAVSAALAGPPPSGAWPFIVAFALAHVADHGEHDRCGTPERLPRSLRPPETARSSGRCGGRCAPISMCCGTSCESLVFLFAASGARRVRRPDHVVVAIGFTATGGGLLLRRRCRRP